MYNETITVMENKELIEELLGIKKNGPKSTLMLAIRAARFNSGRPTDTGEFHHGQFAARYNMSAVATSEETDWEFLKDEASAFNSILLYLIALEQIGAIFFEKKCDKGYRESGIQTALRNMADWLTIEEANAISNLRNSLAHSYGLVNLYKGKNSSKFEIDITTQTTCIVKLPDEEWDGDYNKNGNNTVVYYEPLCNLVENILRGVVEMYTRGELYLKDEDIEKIKRRYFVH